MIIDDDYIQYDTFRIINKADADAIAQFNHDREEITGEADRKAELAKWQAEAEKWRAVTVETEESVYELTYAERMVSRWSREIE